MYSKTNKKKLVVISALLLGIVLLSTGLISAFYSDIFGSHSDVTTGTLKIGGTYTYLVNGEVVEASQINNLNPGDAIVVRANLTNTGNKSAWIRSVISLADADAELLPFITVYRGEISQTDLLTGVDHSVDIITLNQGVALGTNNVINGSGANAETETSSGGGDTTNYLLSSNYNVTFTIYFSHTATNATQNKEFRVEVYAQALQYRNNTTEPNEAAWQTVVAVA